MSAPRVVVFALAALAYCACSSAQRGEPLHGPLVLNAEQTHGEQLFMQYCNKCHPQGAGGLGPALNNKPLPGPAVRKQVRAGIGAMPAFDKQTISDPDLEAISAYVLELHNPGGGR